MARALAVNVDTDSALVGDERLRAPAARPIGGASSQPARVLQKRLHDAYAASAPDEALARDFSPFAQLAIILGMSGALWGVLAWVVSRLV